jgi:hypothetical protein
MGCCFFAVYCNGHGDAPVPIPDALLRASWSVLRRPLFVELVWQVHVHARVSHSLAQFWLRLAAG